MKSIARTLLPFTAILTLAACGESPEAAFAEAQRNFAAENYQEARVRLSVALRQRPEDAKVLALLADTHLRLGDAVSAEAAIARLERAGYGNTARMKAEAALLRQEPARALELVGDADDAESWKVRAEAQLALGDKEAARLAYDRGMASHPDIRLAASHARFLLLEEDLVGAARVLLRMRQMAPRSFETMVLGGDLAAAQGREKEAAAAYRAAVDAFPDRLGPMLALANQYDAMGRLDEAFDLVQQAARFAPGDAEVEAMRIQFLSQKGEWETIRLALQGREADLIPGSTLAMTYGEALLHLGHAEQARAIFRRAVLHFPHNLYAQLMLGRAQLATGDAASSWETLAPLARSTLARPDVLEPAAQAARAAGAPEAAGLQMRLAPARVRETMALIEKGEGALYTRRWREAVSVYQQLLKRGPDAEVLKRLALAYDGLGEVEAAIAHADRAVALNRNNPDYLYVAGALRLSNDRDRAEAQRLLEAAAILDPGNDAIARELRKAKAPGR
ncbi:tetratricopeptide repeat protein [Novosphingobium panipatense]|jgi:tetratricopeptide (TPR) repeat protein|uniref:tetratricopeptide repeat protein n=1 Tax=Novosphingobium TaxID=165696 RepID=UPI000CDAF6B5|nr:tetratricopeptide repeat protein [Novosphingobium sp. HII-3]